MNEAVVNIGGAASRGVAARSNTLTDVFTAVYLMMLCGALYSVFVTASPAGQIMEKAGSSKSYTALWLGLYVLLLFQLRHELINPINLFTRHRWFGLFLLSALISFALSPPATQLVAIKLGMYVMTLLFGLYLARNYTIGQFLSLFLTISAVVLIAHWLIYPVQSQFPYDRMARVTLLGIRPYGGLFGHKNLAGTFFGLSFLASYGRAMVSPRQFQFAILAAGHILALLLAGAAGALLCVIVAALVMTGFYLFGRRSRYALLYLLLIALAVVIVIGLGTSSVLHAVGRDEGMSGRWRVFAVWPDYFWQHPMFGWGYSNFFSDTWNPPSEQLRLLTPYHAWFFTFESAYLEMAIDFGAVGAALFFAMMATGFRDAVRIAMQPDIRFAQVPLGWLIFIAAMSTSDSGLRIHNLVTAALVAWTYFGLRVRRRTRSGAPVESGRPKWTPA